MSITVYNIYMYMYIYIYMYLFIYVCVSRKNISYFCGYLLPMYYPFQGVSGAGLRRATGRASGRAALADFQGWMLGRLR